MSGPRGRRPDDTAATQGVDPWEHAAPLDTGATRPIADDGFEQPTAYRRSVHGQPDFRQPGFGRPPLDEPTRVGPPPAYGPPPYQPPGYGPDGYQPAPPPQRTMSPLALVGVIAAIVVSVGLVIALLSPVFSGRRRDSDNPGQLPGIATGPTGTVAPEPSAEVPSQFAQPDPTDSAAPSAGAAAQDPNADAEADAVRLMNTARRKAGCDPLQADGGLKQASLQHSVDMAASDKLSGKGSDGSSPDDRMHNAGADDPQSESIARGFRSSAEVVRAWLRNGDDRDNIEDCDAHTVGVGVVVNDKGVPFWTADFAGPA